jgi:hypothetical protein
MTRTVSRLPAAAVAAFLAFGGATAFAMATGGDGNGNGGHPGGPNGPSGPSAGNSGGPASIAPRVAGCDYRADQTGLDGAARRAFLWRCQQNGGV